MSQHDGPPEDPLPALRAELDQMIAIAPEIARVVRGFFDAFKAEEFTDSQAAYLTMAKILDKPGEAP